MGTRNFMIGDYAFVKPSGMLIKIAAVHHKKVAYHAVINKLTWVRESLLEPIPLVPKILEKNGFVKVEHYYPYPTYEYKVESLKFVVRVAFPKDSKTTERTKPFAEVDAEWCWYNNDCEFLHDLQQVMRLCRIKKEIIL